MCQIKRYEAPNPFNYSKLELAKRKKALKDLERDYPHLPLGWLEMVYDFEKNTPKEEVEKIINEGLWEGPGKFTPNTEEKSEEKSKKSEKSEI